jgi:hypothetical protein
MRSALPLLLVGSFLLSLPALHQASADELVLNNGRTLKGKIVRQDARSVVFRSARGKFSVPRSVIARVVSSTSPHATLKARREGLDPQDAEGLAELAEWAAANGLGRQALDLRAEARALGLTLRLEKAERADTARAFVRVFHWGRRSGVDRVSLIAVLAAARQRDARDPELQSAAESYHRQLVAEEERLRKAAAALRRPRYKDPKATDTAQGTTKTWRAPRKLDRAKSADELDEERARVAAARAALKGYARSREGRIQRR